MAQSALPPIDVLTQMLIEGVAPDDAPDPTSFEVGDGLNLFIAPRGANAMAHMIAAADRRSSPRFFHAAGLSADCRDPEYFLWRLLTDLRRQFDFIDPVPLDPEARRDTLPNWLARASAMGGLTVIVQDAHELSRDGLTADLDWLPEWLPQGVTVMISAPPGPASEQFRDRSAAVFKVPENDSPGAKDRIPGHLLESDSAGSWLELLWISRAGLEISDLEALTHSPLDGFAPELPGLLYDGRRVALASAQARDAVARRRLGDHGRRQELHVRMAEYFGGRASADALELACWHWAAAGRRDRLEENLTHSILLEAMSAPAHAFEALRHWRALGGSERMSESLNAACEVSDRSSGVLLGAAHILSVGTGKDAPAKWLQLAAERAETGGNSPALIRAYQLLAAHDETSCADAEALIRRALALAERGSDIDKAVPASLHHRRACLLETEGRETEARSAYESAVAGMESAAGGDSPRLIPWLNNLAAAHKNTGDLRAADRVARRALRLSREQLGARHPTTAVCSDQLAGIAYTGGQYESAEDLYRETQEVTEAAFGPNHPATAACLGNLGSVLDARQKFVEAEKCHRRSLGLLMTLHGEKDADTASCMHNLAVALESLGKSAEAERLYRRALETWNEVTGEKSPAFATTLLNLAGVLRERGAWGEAEALYRSDIELWREMQGPDHPHTLGALTELARLYVDGGKPEMAEPLLLHLAERTAANSGKTGTAYLEVAALLAAVQHRFGHNDEARALLHDALAASEGTLNMLSAPVQKLRKLLAQIDDKSPETRH